ncbi:hypothetical protein ANCCAN_24835 [Ancylostoma caninum]|uniref:Uncharacterized protein n=1 Tax=Ancylostoma caninum TaxID=29170 RepID=A0A368FF07_ANCCA|nr:hypothetical protein ANCCAN_24835 [Ancylostoma caninum]
MRAILAAMGSEMTNGVTRTWVHPKTTSGCYVLHDGVLGDVDDSAPRDSASCRHGMYKFASAMSLVSDKLPRRSLVLA